MSEPNTPQRWGTDVSKMTDSQRLRLLADWFDKEQKHRWNAGDAEVQGDLRRIADQLEKLPSAEPQPPKIEPNTPQRRRSCSICGAFEGELHDLSCSHGAGIVVLLGEEPQPPQAAARVDIDHLESLLRHQAWTAGGVILEIVEALPAVFAELRELRKSKAKLFAEFAVAKMQVGIANDFLAASQEQERKYREMLNDVLSDLSMFCGEQDIVKIIRCKIDAALAQP